MRLGRSTNRDRDLDLGMGIGMGMGKGMGSSSNLTTNGLRGEPVLIPMAVSPTREKADRDLERGSGDGSPGASSSTSTGPSPTPLRISPPGRPNSNSNSDSDQLELEGGYLRLDSARTLADHDADPQALPEWNNLKDSESDAQVEAEAEAAGGSNSEGRTIGELQDRECIPISHPLSDTSNYCSDDSGVT